MKGIIIDDEINSVELLQFLIRENCPELTIVAGETSPQRGIEAIEKWKPDVVFLDIEMPEMSGFQLLENLQHLSFHVIFTTAFDNYALKAFKYNTVDYLLKPIIVKELKTATDKLKKRIADHAGQPSVSHLLQAIKEAQYQSKVAINGQNEILYLDPEKIIRLESDSNYTNFFLIDGKKITSAKTLKEYEQLLNPFLFFRTHKTYMVNLSHVDKFVKGEGGYLVMKDASQIPVARERRQELMNVLATR